MHDCQTPQRAAQSPVPQMRRMPAWVVDVGWFEHDSSTWVLSWYLP